MLLCVFKKGWLHQSLANNWKMCCCSLLTSSQHVALHAVLLHSCTLLQGNIIILLNQPVLSWKCWWLHYKQTALKINSEGKKIQMHAVSTKHFSATVGLSVPCVLVIHSCNFSLQVAGTSSTISVPTRIQNPVRAHLSNLNQRLV